MPSSPKTAISGEFLLSKKEVSPLVMTLTLVAAAIVFSGILFSVFYFNLIFAHSREPLAKPQAPQVENQQNEFDQQRKTDLNFLRERLLTYKKDNGNFPTTLAALQPKYFVVVPVDPETKVAYSYQASLDGNSFTLSGFLSNGSEIEVTDQTLLN